MPANGMLGYPPSGGIVFGQGYAVAVAANVETSGLTFGSVPLVGSETITVNTRTLAPGLDYTISSNQVRLVADLSLSDVVQARWATRAAQAGGITLGGPSPYAAAVLLDTPWGWWRQKEATATTSLADSSGNSRLMSTAGTLTSVAGPRGKALSYPAAGPAAFTSAFTTTSTASVEVWTYIPANPASKTALLGLHVAANSTGDKDVYVSTDGKANFYWFDGTARTITSASAMTANVWHHIVATVGPAGTFLYIDGVQVATHASTTSYTGSNQVVNAHYGTDAGNALYTGETILIAEPAFYTGQLSATRVLAHYSAV